MIKLLTLLTFLLSSFCANASVVLNNGESFSSSFQLQDNGEIFKTTDSFWESLAKMKLTKTAPGVSIAGKFNITFFDNLDFSNQITSKNVGINSPLDIPFTRLLATGHHPVFSNHTGSFIFTNTGSSQIELFLVVIADFSGNTGPSNVAIASIVPSAVPLPAAGWLMISTLGMLGLFRNKKTKISSSTV